MSTYKATAHKDHDRTVYTVVNEHGDKSVHKFLTQREAEQYARILNTESKGK